MFDWDDKELSNIIWGEAGENEEHIVPYPDETFEKSANVNLTHYDTHDEKAQVDYDWPNMRSFDDLNGVISNNDSVYRNVNISNAGALWSSSKDVIGCQGKSELLSIATNKSSPGYNVMGKQHSGGPTLPHQQASSASSYISEKTPKMTPQEKIEKLRMRQQMQALLAIRKQQQEYKKQVPCDDYYDESQLKLQIIKNQSDLDTRDAMMMMMDKSTLEDTILHQLQNVIATLGIQIRVCIRDSLFRLAQSALQRQYDVDTITTIKRRRDEPTVVMEERFSTRCSAKMPDVETKTNPIDRAVAHLLFHTPPQITNFPMELLNSSYKDDQG